jgi:hypothetical protein
MKTKSHKAKADAEMRTALNVINALRRRGLSDVEIIKRLGMDEQLLEWFSVGESDEE